MLSARFLPRTPQTRNSGTARVTDLVDSTGIGLLWLQEGRGLSATEAGVVQLPVFGVALVVSSLTGRNPRIRGKLLVASAGQLAACVLLLLANPATPVTALLGVMAVFGVPQGLNSLALQTASTTRPTRPASARPPACSAPSCTWGR
ncbi:MAG TPA: hypothetical protein VFC19_54375 [Candidatus Limnocylindrales bacterium]|nr:hypothetical protein [Candidatus Limnocylindrales bacterium]